ncbi:YigZ family protein [Thalassomonas sp. M1454]|uniref:YigZ family protein n=1 Tax=Thalassomonas sp. M1454 TaxID=2594477 RepID=UPI00117EB7A1|nr:YigZ family protein [Thalassomonas sp. M1454]TRX58146.1 YigZ family protein [Thalassomonas sp. M1454]
MKDFVNATPYLIPTDEIEVETIVNRSRFICAIKHCSDNTAVKAFIEQIRLQYPDASHHCYAFVSSRPDDSQSYGFSDDGEPSGTAGRPMLAMLQGSQIGELCAVVTRYFGGVKLGTGGLQRAYGNSVRQALLELPTQLKTPTEQVHLSCEYHQIKDIEHYAEQFNGKVVEQTYGEQVQLLIELPIPVITDFCQRIIEITGGQVSPKTNNNKE